MFRNIEWEGCAPGINKNGQKFRKILLILVILSILIAIDTVHAVPANPAPFSLSQPDGSVFVARQVGDERGAHLETMDGFTVIKEETGWWNYAMKDQSGKLITTGQITGLSDPKKLGLQKHLHPDRQLILPDYATGEFSKGFSSSRVSPPALAPQTGTKKALVILVNFTDVGQEANHSPLYYDDLLFNSTAGASSMHNYYKEVSFNMTNITGMVAGSRWFSVSNNIKWYGEDYTDIDSNETHADPNNWYIFKLAKEAVIAADPYVDYSQYDSDNDGEVDHLIIVHAGNGQESSGNSTDIWSHKWSIYVWTGVWNLGYMTGDGVKVVSYTMQSESSPLGTFAHEFGHDLGLPDLYDIDYSSFGAGYWDIMASGSWLNSGDTPSHLSVWSRYFLGWMNPNKVNRSSPDEPINYSEAYDDAYMLLDNPGDTPGNLNWTSSGNGTGEYFLIENRRKTGYDAYLPGEGLLIWHINESRGNNSNDILRLVDLEEADGLNHLDTKMNYGDAFDPWYSSAGGFYESSNPNSNLYNGSASGIRISNISASSNVMTANLIINWPPPVITFVSPTPPNTSAISQDYVLVNITASEALNTSFLEWNGFNESMSGSGKNWSRNMTGLTSGVYNYRVWADDSGGNLNVSETRTVTINANSVSTCTSLDSPGYYTLTGSITNSGVTNCISITTNNVTLDGAGHTIDGQDLLDSYGVFVHNATESITNITVRNLTVTDWHHGIHFNNTANVLVENNNASMNSYNGIFISYTINADTSNNTMNSNSKAGIVLMSVSNSSLFNNTATSNTDSGIYLSGSVRNNLRNNYASLNGNGFYVISSSNNTIESNNATLNNDFGFYLVSSSINNILNNNSANSNLNAGGIGISSFSNLNTLSNNSLVSNFQGLVVETSYSNKIMNNSISWSNKNGIVLISTSNNDLVGNKAISNYLNGISLIFSSYNNVSGNTLDSNNKGINVGFSTGNNLTLNNMSGNTYNFDLYGVQYEDFNNSIDTSNVVDLKPVMYLTNASDIEYNSSTNAGLLYCILCNNVTVRDLLFSKNGAGVFFWRTNNSLIENITAISDIEGINLEYSYNNTIKGNNASINSYGIHLTDSWNNIISDNMGFSNDIGINVNSSWANIITNNNASSNNQYGLYLQISGDNNLSGNIADSNVFSGIFIDKDSNSNLLFNNSANSNLFYAIYLKDSGSNILNKNNASNSSYGFGLDNSSNNNLSENTAMNNTAWDFFLISASSNNTVLNLTINPIISFRGKDISIKSESSRPADPGNYRNISKYINASNTSADSWLFLNVSYDESDISGMNEGSFAMWRHNGSTWSQVGGMNGVDTVQNYVYANITNFSIFAPIGVSSNIDSCTDISIPGNYTLTGDIIESVVLQCIKITSSDVILDGSGHTIDGIGTMGSFGIVVHNSTESLKNVTVRNFTVTDWEHGISYTDTSNGNIENVNSSLNTVVGIELVNSSSNILMNNTAGSNGIGISLDVYSNSNILNDNMAQENSLYDILPNVERCENILVNNTGSGNRQIKFFNSSVNIQNEILSGLILCDADNSIINNVTIEGSITENNNGLIVSWTDNSSFERINSSNNKDGISFYSSENNTLIDSAAISNSGNGISIYSSIGNNITNNTANLNDYGFYIWGGGKNNLRENNASYNSYGIELSWSNNNTLINNTDNGNTILDFKSSVSVNNTVLNLDINPVISFNGEDIALKSVSSPPPDPIGYHNLTRYINATNTSYYSWLLWNVSYDDSEVSNLNESSLRIWRYSGSSWSQVANSGVDTAQNRIYANITSFSIFAPMGEGDTTPPSVTNLNVSPSAPKTGESVNITADASDVNMNFTSVYVSVIHPDGTMNLSQMSGNGSYYYVYSNTSVEGRYNVTINASDILGNFNNTQSTWFVVTSSFSANTSSNDTERGYGARIWNSTNFPGFVDNEELSVLNVSDRLIDLNDLWYNTSINITQYYVNANWNKSVENALDQNGVKQPAGGGFYKRLGWIGTPYVIFNGTANKIAELVLEHGYEVSGKKTMIAGEIWYIGNGWTLKVNSIDAVSSPRQVWLTLSKNGAVLDDRIVNDKDVYNYSIQNWAGESDVPVFATYVDSIFSGATVDLVQLRYTWVISDSVTNVTDGQVFGDLVVSQSTPAQLNLTNSNSGINLSRNSTINLGDRLYFNVLDNTSLEYYPFIAPVHIDALSLTDTTLDVFEKSGTAGGVNIIRMKDTPPGINRSFSLTPFGKYVSIDPTQNVAGNLSWVKIRIYYTGTELSNSNLIESSLKIAWYNESPGAWEILTTGLNTTDTMGYTGFVEANISRFSYYGIFGTPVSTDSPSQTPCTSCGGGGGSGGGGGGGTSGENYSNIELKEKRDMHIFKDKVASYKFNTTDPIMYVNIKGNISAGEVTTIVEVLRNTSTLVKNISAPGIVYKNVNIWVGTAGFATPRNIKQGVIGFRVRNSWLDEKELEAGDVRLVKWDGSGWIELVTNETTKGTEHVYYEAVTDSFSPFAVTAFRSAQPPVGTPVTISETKAPDNIEPEPEVKSGLNGILLVTALVLVIIVAIIAALREKKKM